MGLCPETPILCIARTGDKVSRDMTKPGTSGLRCHTLSTAAMKNLLRIDPNPLRHGHSARIRSRSCADSMLDFACTHLRGVGVGRAVPRRPHVLELNSNFSKCFRDDGNKHVLKHEYFSCEESFIPATLVLEVDPSTEPVDFSRTMLVFKNNPSNERLGGAKP